MTSLGLRNFDPGHPEHLGRQPGDPFARDSAYHQGTVWPWLNGPYVEAALRIGVAVDGIVDGLAAQLGEWGAGCPFQAWSVVELLRAWRLLTRGAPAPA